MTTIREVLEKLIGKMWVYCSDNQDDVGFIEQHENIFIDQALADIKAIRLAELPEEKDEDYFIQFVITHADKDLTRIQARAMEIGSNRAIVAMRKIIEEDK